jgi:hypothetical protein
MDMYADPQNPNIVDELSRRDINETTAEDTIDVEISTQARFRSESFGATIYKVNPLALVLVNHSTATFLRIIAKNRQKIRLSTFLERSGAKTEDERRGVVRLYRKLIKKGFLITQIDD